MLCQSLLLVVQISRFLYFDFFARARNQVYKYRVEFNDLSRVQWLKFNDWSFFKNFLRYAFSNDNWESLKSISPSHLYNDCFILPILQRVAGPPGCAWFTKNRSFTRSSREFKVQGVQREPGVQGPDTNSLWCQAFGHGRLPYRSLLQMPFRAQSKPSDSNWYLCSIDAEFFHENIK